MKEVIKKRNFGLDLIRSVAIIFVIAVHSFGNTKFNDMDMQGMAAFIALSIKWLTITCVPLFIILTGYCKNNKQPNKEHYKKIINLIIIYLIISIITVIFRFFILKDGTSLYNLIIGIFNCSTIPYAWYFEMYIGLFLLIPFLNIMYNNISTKKEKQILIISLIFVCSIPETLAALNVSGHTFDIAPSWWGSLYPIMYYLIGCYIHEYQIRINKVVNMFFIAVTLFITTFMTYFYCQGKSLNSVLAINYNFLPINLIAILLFCLLYNITCEKKIFVKIISSLSKYSFGIYLLSYCFDNLFYKIINLQFENTFFPFIGLSIYTPVILISSLIIIFIIEKIISLVKRLCEKKLQI